MPQYAVIVYSQAPADPMALTPDYLKKIDGYADLAKELGGKVLGGSYFSAERGFAFEPSTSAISISGETVGSGPLVESDLVVAALFVLSARDIETAVRIAQQHPAVRDGGVEVRPLFAQPKK